MRETACGAAAEDETDQRPTSLAANGLGSNVRNAHFVLGSSAAQKWYSTMHDQSHRER
jgi:hypothetical protein